MRIFTGSIYTETNTFAPLLTGWLSFEDNGIFRGNGSLTPNGVLPGMLQIIREDALADGHEVIESVSAMAQPSGRVLDDVYTSLRDELLDDLKRALPVEAVILDLHGAMSAVSFDDCEGDLLRRIRELTGLNVAIGVLLDLHCHVSEVMLSASDILIAYKEYPHTDTVERMREVYRLTIDTAEGLISPTTACFDCRMVGQWHTTHQPTTDLVRQMQKLEGTDGILSVSFGHGFPWGDVADSGAKVWVITDGNMAKADEVARLLAHRVWDDRHATRAAILSVDEALDRAMAVPNGPVIVADVTDNAGGGAPSDSTFILRRVVERGISDVALGYVWDLGAVFICRDAGVGASFNLRVGGKVGPMSGDPIDIRVTVKEIIPDHFESGIGLHWPLGPSVWVEGPNRLDIVLVSNRNQAMDPRGFTALGIDLSSKSVIVVKSMQHFYAEFAPLASEVLYAEAPGALSMSFETMPYLTRSLNYWPRVQDPFA